MALLKFILGFFVFSYLIKLLFRFLAPYLLKRFANKMQDKFGQQFNHNSYSNKEPAQPEGKVTIEKKKSTERKSDNIGDYVDFEEIKE
ncbi:MAG: DUF4834 family protein [Flavobacteriales bacterium]|nr:DUF4834 family protein [Flavobacteriales bacterium]